MSRSVSYEFDGAVVAVTGGAGALGGATVEAFHEAGATVSAIDVADPDDAALPTGVGYHQADLTDESAVQATVEAIVDEHDRLDALCNIAGTWRGGDPLSETDVSTFELLFDVNLRTMFLTSKHALPAVDAAEGAIVSVASRSSLEGGPNDGPYRASKAGVRILTETIAAEHRGRVQANAVMPSVLDTPMNREMMEPSDDWVDPAEVADVIAFLCSDAAAVTSGAAVPVYGEA